MDKPAGKRRRLWFWLTWNLAFLLIGALGAWIAWSFMQVQAREEMLVRIELNGGSIVLASEQKNAASAKQNSLPVVWQFCGAKRIAWLLLPSGFTPSDQSRIQQLFPEARVGPLNPGRAHLD